MSTLAACVAGVFFGFLGCLIPGVLFERALSKGTSASVGAGLAGILVSYLVQCLAVLAVYLAADEVLMEFGCTMVASFLAFWGVEAVRAWRAAQSDAHSRGRR